MSGSDLLMLAGVFLGGAIPWLEAIVVIPAGIVAGLNPVMVVLAGATGNLITVGVAAWFGERIRLWWLARRRRKRSAEARDGSPEPPVAKRGKRVERVMQRWGLPALAMLGPLGLGTQVSAVVAVSLGTGAWTAFGWIGAGTVLWSIVAAVVALTGLSIAGVG